MAKKAKVNLTNEPLYLDFYSTHFALCYSAPMQLVDIFSKEGEKIKSYNIEEQLAKYDIELI